MELITVWTGAVNTPDRGLLTRFLSPGSAFPDPVKPAPPITKPGLDPRQRQQGETSRMLLLAALDRAMGFTSARQLAKLSRLHHNTVQTWLAYLADEGLAEYAIVPSATGNPLRVWRKKR